MNDLMLAGLKAMILVPITLLPIMNPLGTAPIFLSMTTGLDESTSRRLALRVAMHSFLLLAGAIFVGSYVLAFFGLSVPIVRVAGGLLVAATAWRLLNDDSDINGDGAVRSSVAEEGNASRNSAELSRRAFYPIAFPLTVGPGTIAAAIALGTQHAESMSDRLKSDAAFLVGTLITVATAYFAYRYAKRLLHFLGDIGTIVVMRLSAFILLCIGFQIMWTGLSTLFSEAR